MSSSRTYQWSAEDFRWYTTITGDKVMATERPAFNTAGITGSKDTRKMNARGFIALGAGDIQIRPLWTKDAAGNDQTFTVSVGQWYPLQFSHIIDAGTTVTNLLVIW